MTFQINSCFKWQFEKRSRSKSPVALASLLSCLVCSPGQALTNSNAAASLNPHTKETLVATSGKAHMRLVELYTSESCSSCPPADAWVSALQSHTDLWKSFVPVVFHVDYWNDLGWKDAFSSETMTRRQRELSNRWSQPAVYTPSFIIDGAEWKSWRSESAIATKFEAAQATRLTVENQSIEVSIFKRANGSIQVNLSGLLSNRHYVLRVAQLGFSISTDVKSGENSGKLLKHDFVVLNWLSEQISTQGSPGTSVGASPGAHKIDVIERTFQFATPARTTKRMAVAAWVESENNPTPLQAAGGHL